MTTVTVIEEKEECRRLNLDVNVLPAHMIRTTTMMISSPALSCAWPTSFIVTSSDKTHKHKRAYEEKEKGNPVSTVFWQT